MQTQPRAGSASEAVRCVDHEVKQRAGTEGPALSKSAQRQVAQRCLPRVERVCGEGATQRIENHGSEEVVEIDGICKLEQNELVSISPKTKDNERQHEMNGHMAVAVPGDPAFHHDLSDLSDRQVGQHGSYSAVSTFGDGCGMYSRCCWFCRKLAFGSPFIG